MAAYYNENNDYAADWLENLIRDGLIAAGVVDRRSIDDVCAGDLDGFDQVASVGAPRSRAHAYYSIWTAGCGRMGLARRSIL